MKKVFSVFSRHDVFAGDYRFGGTLGRYGGEGRSEQEANSARYTDKGPQSVEFTGSTKGADKVKIGDKVKINYTEKSGKNVAETIDAGKSSAAPSPGERPAAPGGMKKDAPPASD